MQQSESIAALVAALAKAQGEIRNPALDKAHPHFKGFRYATLGSHIDAIREPLSRNGLILTQGVNSHGNEVSVSTQVAHISGEWMRSTVGMVLPDKATAQNLGAVVTYLRRYAMAAALMLTGDDDTDADEDREARQPQRPAPAPAPSTRDLLDPTPTRRAAPAKAAEAPKAAPAAKPDATRRWPDAGSDSVMLIRAVERDAGVIAVFCSHPVHGSVWVSFPGDYLQMDGVEVGRIAEIAWKWDPAGFYKATGCKAVSYVGSDPEIPY
jgi:hypothetical protein